MWDWLGPALLWVKEYGPPIATVFGALIAGCIAVFVGVRSQAVSAGTKLVEKADEILIESIEYFDSLTELTRSALVHSTQSAADSQRIVRDHMSLLTTQYRSIQIKIDARCGARSHVSAGFADLERFIDQQLFNIPAGSARAHLWNAIGDIGGRREAYCLLTTKHLRAMARGHLNGSAWWTIHTPWWRYNFDRYSQSPNAARRHSRLYADPLFVRPA